MQKLRYKPPIPVQDLTLIYPICAGLTKTFHQQQVLKLSNMAMQRAFLQTFKLPR